MTIAKLEDAVDGIVYAIWQQDIDDGEASEMIRRAIRAAVNAERTACVEIALSRAHPQASLAVATTATSIANAIKARRMSEKQTGADHFSQAGKMVGSDSQPGE